MRYSDRPIIIFPVLQHRPLACCAKLQFSFPSGAQPRRWLAFLFALTHTFFSSLVRVRQRLKFLFSFLFLPHFVVVAVRFIKTIIMYPYSVCVCVCCVFFFSYVDLCFNNIVNLHLLSSMVAHGTTNSNTPIVSRVFVWLCVSGGVSALAYCYNFRGSIRPMMGMPVGWLGGVFGVVVVIIVCTRVLA